MSMKHRYSQTILACLLCFFLGTPLFAADEDLFNLSRSGKAFSSVVQKAGPAVVHIRVEKTTKGIGINRQMRDMFNDPFFEHFFGRQFERFRQQEPQEFRRHGAGSGFIISADGLILTNNHVVEGAEDIRVSLADKREFTATVVGTDPQSDVALIKIDGNNLPTLPLGDSKALEVGEWVIAIGSPFELSQSVTVGVVSAKGRSRMGINDYENFIQTDAAINPGNSGGPLLNIQGQAVGINTAIFSRSGGHMGIGFAIPMDMVKSIKEQLLQQGKVVRGWLGLIIQDLDKDLAQSFGLKAVEGVLVSEVTEGSPAAKAGVQQGDVLLTLDGIKLFDVNDVRNRVALTAPGSTVQLDLIREGRRQKLTVYIEEQPANFSSMGRKSPEQQGGGSHLDGLGLSLQELTPELAQQFGYKHHQGLLISEVLPGSPADILGLQTGQLVEEINQVRVQSLEEVEKALAQGRNPQQVLLRVRTGEFSKYVVLQIKD
jgi:serine protease Do